MSFKESYNCARTMEAIENYACADYPFIEPQEEYREPEEYRDLEEYREIVQYDRQADRPEDIIRSDGEFWFPALQGRSPWGKGFRCYRVGLSEWVARVPGLYWTRGAERLRQAGISKVEKVTEHWITYEPQGKSLIVSGGVGTLKFPPDNNGFRLVSLSLGYNASTGIPALIAPEVWEHHQLKEGDILILTAHWQKMELGWAERFASIKGIPRGYLLVTDPGQIEKEREMAPIEIHPCTVMQYTQGPVTLFDFVFASAQTGNPEYRGQVSRFFDSYKDKHERYGRYLLAADIGDPLWTAEYVSPAELRRADPGAESHLALLEARVNSSLQHSASLDSILEELTNVGDNVSLQRLSSSLGIPAILWFKGGSVADSASQFLAICVERNKVDELLVKMVDTDCNLILGG